ncbi:hypothetical protein [uncultured Roseibium sp.]|uniref:hypothetical protein n=1 Tax=uncultured Roseibium sp. TaxID=1936171 RepID=UPI0026214099|nr:hypothetical protein [uncultured Roseibium sp.]
MLKHTVIAVTFGTFAMTSAALAQAPDFSTVDANQDSLLTIEELASVGVPITEETFSAADTNQDGTLDKDEYSAIEL